MGRYALSARGVERDYGIDRTAVAEAIRSGDLRASRLGARRFTLLRTDVEQWLRRYAVTPTARAQARVHEVLEAEGGA